MVTEGSGSGFPTFAVVCSALAVLAVVFALSMFLEGGWLAMRSREYERKVLAPENTEVQEALAAQEAALDAGYRWIDQEAGKVGLPVDRAVELIVERGGRLVADPAP